MPAHRFNFEIDGQTIYGLAFESEAELEEFIGCRGAGKREMQTPAYSKHRHAAEVVGKDPQPVGRPSSASAIASAADALAPELAALGTTSDRARLVIRHMAKNHGAAEIPSMSTVRAFLTARKPVAENAAGNSARKPKRASIHRTGES